MATDGGNSATTASQHWWLLWDLVIQQTVGTVIYVMIFGAAVGLHQLVLWMAELKIDHFFVLLLKSVKYLIVAGDTILFMVFLFRVMCRFLRQLKDVRVEPDAFLGSQNKGWLIWAFFIHLTIGSAIFVSICVPVVCLHLFVGWAADLHIDRLLLSVLMGVEYIFIVGNVFLGVVFLSTAIGRFLKQLITCNI